MSTKFSAGNERRYYPSITLSLSPDEVEFLREMAKEFGFLIGRGNMAYEGSIQQLIKSIAAGYLVPVPFDEWYNKAETKEVKDEQQ